MKKWTAKKIVAMLLALVTCVAFLSLGFAAFAGAEAVAGSEAEAFNATPIVAGIIVLIGVALGSFLLWLTYKYIVPLLKVPILGTVAKWAVDLAEQAFGRGNGDAKYDTAAAFVVKALEWIHIKVDQQAIRAAIISAWTALNLAQIAAGIKAAAESAEAQKPAEEADTT